MNDASPADPRRRRLARLALILVAASVMLFLFCGFVLAPMSNTNENLTVFEGPLLLLSFQLIVGALNALIWIGLRRTRPRWRGLQIALLAIGSIALTVALTFPLGWLYDLMFPLSRT